jgi:hypothetical protein
MTTQAIEQYLCLLDNAFAGPDWHSLLSNLHSVASEDWNWVPRGGVRSIRAIVRHLGRVKLMAHDQAFGPGTLTWDDAGGDEETSDVPTTIAWLRMGHERLRSGVAALADDAELLRPRRTNWGELRETRWIIVVTFWREHTLRLLIAARDNTARPEPIADEQQANEQTFANHQHTAWDEVIAESDQVFREAKQVIAQLTDAQLTEVVGTGTVDVRLYERVASD